MANKNLNDYEVFLALFLQLKTEVKNSPLTLEWLQTYTPKLRRLCMELNHVCQTISKNIATNSSKLYVAPKSFNKHWKEYNKDYLKIVEDIGNKESKEAIRKALAELQSILKKPSIEAVAEEILKNDNESRKIGSYFDPTKDDPVKLIYDIFLTYHDMYVNDFCDDENINMDKAIGAWDFFQNTIGINFKEIYKRWINSPHIFIPDDYRNQNIESLVDLYNEAVKTYIFGNKLASLAICRALLENVLINYYNLNEGDLDKIITTAEIKYPYFKQLELHKKRRMVNRILHNYKKDRPIKDGDVLDFLHTLKNLIQKIPI